MTISGAYGKDYKNAKDAKADFLAGKDFVIRSIVHGAGMYVSKRDLPAGTMVTIRYDKDRKAVCVTV